MANTSRWLILLTMMSITTASHGVTIIPLDLPASGPCVSPDEWDELRSRAATNLARLEREGRLSPALRGEPVRFAWPLRPAAALEDDGYHAISGYYDHDQTAGTLDHACGSRTYDGHNGTDYASWPFGWYKMDHDLVEIIAAADGVIFDRRDGFDDRSCTPGGTSNMVAIRHADGTRAWYLHMKLGSLTDKPIGAPVTSGEYLGIVGSSGNSSGPHLHFDVRDADWNSFDAYDGACNESTTGSWWIEQSPYHDSAINTVLTHSAIPEIPPCPEQEILHLRDTFAPGDSVVVGIYHRDLLEGQPVTYSIRQPDGAIADGGTYAIEVPHYPAAAAIPVFHLPADALPGTWTIEVDYEGTMWERSFSVSGSVGVAVESAAGRGHLRVTPNPFSDVTSIRSGGEIVDVFAADGRRVRELRPAADGVLRLNWDGRTDSGERALPGVYFVRVRGRDDIPAMRVVRVP